MVKSGSERIRAYRQRKKEQGGYNLNVFIGEMEAKIIKKYSERFDESLGAVASRALRLLNYSFMKGPKSDSLEDKYFSLGPPQDSTKKNRRKKQKPHRVIRI